MPLDWETKGLGDWKIAALRISWLQSTHFLVLAILRFPFQYFILTLSTSSSLSPLVSQSPSLFIDLYKMLVLEWPVIKDLLEPIEDKIPDCKFLPFLREFRMPVELLQSFLHHGGMCLFETGQTVDRLGIVVFG